MLQAWCWPLAAALLLPLVAALITASVAALIGWRGLDTRELHFDGVRVGHEHLVGDPDAGLGQFLGTLEVGRISIAALSLSLTQAVLDQLTDGVTAGEIPLYQQGGAPEMSWRGLARYWTKKSEADS